MNSDKLKPKVIVICGPTGVGKTSVALELAKTFNGEIINADSMQIYRHMDIGTAKPTTSEQALIFHHMINIVNLDDHFDAAKYAKKACQVILKLHEKGITPFVVGGTGLYIKALLHGLFKAGASDPNIRKRLQEEAKLHGTGFLYKRLSQCDPEAAKGLHPNDTFRIIRALEVYKLTDKPISEHQHGHGFVDRPFNAIKIGLEMGREVLYERINQRVDAMIEAGFIDEVKKLLGMGYSADLKSMQSIGYRHIVDYIKGSISWDETVRTLKRDTRRYAKRQLTWFKADSEIVWIIPEHLTHIVDFLSEFLKE